MQSLKLRREELNSKEHELRQSLANFEKYINVNVNFLSYIKQLQESHKSSLFRNLIRNECEHLNEHKMNVNFHQ